MGWHVSGQLKPQTLGPGASLETAMSLSSWHGADLSKAALPINTTASRMRSGSGGRACLSVHSGVAGHSGSIRDTPVQPKRLSRVGLSGCPRCFLSCASCRWWRSRSSHHRDTATNDYAACLDGCPTVKTSTLNTCSYGSFIVSSLWQ